MTATLADHKLDRERIQAQRAEASARKAEAQVLPRAGVLRAGLRVRAEVLAGLDLLLERWMLDTAGITDETALHHAMSLVSHELLTGLGERSQQVSAAQPEVGEAFAHGATPRRVLTVSQWAQDFRKLKSGTNSPGDWNNALAPYLVEIMDALSEHSPVRYVTFMKSSGVGGTEVLFNWVGYVMHHLGNKDMLIVEPTLELRDRSLNPRLAKMMAETPALTELVATGTRNKANRAEVLEYGPHARLIKAGANSPDSMRSDHVPYVAADEVAAFKWDVGGEGDPMLLIDNRQRTYTRAKSYFVSTPTIEKICRIELLYSRSDQRRYHVPCPHCAEMQPLEFGGKDTPHGLKWRVQELPGETPQVVKAWYVCKHCGAEIEEAHKPDMLSAGRWVAKHPERKLHRGYHINALYAPVGLGLGWLKVAQKWVEAQGDSAELKAFVNTYLGETWKEEGDSIEPVGLMTRLEEYAVDLAFSLRTGGVDVQKDRLEGTLVGWDEKEQGWASKHIIIPGDTSDSTNACWAELAEELRDFRVDIACIDAGYNTSAVKDFCARHRFCVATKGIPGAGRPLVEDEKKRKQRLRSQRKKAQPVEPLGVDQGKALLYARLKLNQPGPGFIHFPNTPDFDEEYFAQLAAEKLVTKFRGTRPFLEWVQLRPRNEALDCMVLNLAALRLAPLILKRSNLALPAAVPAAAPGKAPAPKPATGGKVSLGGARFGKAVA